MSRSRYAALALLYALILAYAGTIVGPVGLHFVWIDPADALQRLLHMEFVAHGSDQRSDWMGNLVALVPLGFLVAGCLTQKEPADSEPALSGAVAVGAFIPCLAVILAVKYVQLFFPPRTVTLNYVVAQMLGSCIGIGLFGAMGSALVEAGRGFSRLETLRFILGVYSGLLIVFMLMPLDFALSVDDVAGQLAKVPDSFTSFSGEGRPLLVAVVINLTSMAAAAPVGALLTIVNRGRIYIGRSTGAAAWIGFSLMFAVYAATTLVISGSASLPAVGLRTIGIGFGAWFMHWLTRQDPDELRDDLGGMVALAAPVYLLTLFAVNGLLSLDWLGLGGAYDQFFSRGLYPLFDYYIVTKAQAAKNIVGHVAMYAPIGVMVWLRAREGDGRTVALWLAMLLSAAIEAARAFRPGLAPDINAVAVAGIAAWAAAALMPKLWEMLGAVSIGRWLTAARPPPGSVAPLNWRDRDAARRTRRRDRANEREAGSGGDVEHY